MTEEDDFDHIAHSKMLSNITSGKIKKQTKKQTSESVGVNELLNAIRSTKNVGKAREALTKEKKKRGKNSAAQLTLQTPLSRLEVEKIQSTVGYDELQKDLTAWEPIVEEQKTAAHLVFPLNKEFVGLETSAERNDGFVPRTALEKAMDAVLSSSKCNLKNSCQLTDAEKEIISAMNEKDAKERLVKLQKMRSLQSFQEAKFRRQKKIKSKNYHRIMKRTKRRQQLKEFDDLVVRDPESAKAKLEEIERDRIFERATLKHRSQNKFSKVLAKHASNDVNARKLMEDHIRFGKELKQKVSLEDDADSSSGEEGDGASNDDLVQMAVAEANQSEENEEEVNAKIKKMRKDKEKKRMEDRNRASGSEAPISIAEEVPFECAGDVTAENGAPDPKAEQSVGATKQRKKLKKKSGKEARKPNADEADVDEMFEAVESKIKSVDANMEKSRAPTAKKRRLAERRTKDMTAEKVTETMDLTLDPQNYLKMDTAHLNQVGANLAEGDALLQEEAAMADAFADDDVMAEFADEKEEQAEAERKKDIDLTLLGWGSWTGPGIDNSRKKKYIVKAKEQRRKDGGKMGLVISEKIDKALGALQPRSVPFPFTRADDFETVLAQPIGKEWNALKAHREITKPSIRTSGGRPILPMSKKDMLRSHVEDV